MSFVSSCGYPGTDEQSLDEAVYHFRYMVGLWSVQFTIDLQSDIVITHCTCTFEFVLFTVSMHN